VSQSRPKPANRTEEIAAALDWLRPTAIDAEGYPDVQVDLTRPSVSRDEAFAILSLAAEAEMLVKLLADALIWQVEEHKCCSEHPETVQALAQYAEWCMEQS